MYFRLKNVTYSVSLEMEKTNMPEDMECVDEQNDLEIACEEPTEISSGTSSSLNTLKLPQEEQRASEFGDFLDEYGLHCSEDISQQPNVMEGEKHPSWLIDHLDSMKETLEKELIDLQDDLKDPFELNYDDTSEEQVMEEIRKMEAKEENENQNANLQATPIYPGARLTIGISALLVMAVVLRHSLTGQALNDILKLIWLHCLGSSEALRSMNALKKCFCNLSSPLTFHWYCSYCFVLMDKNNHEKFCPNSFYRKDFSVSDGLYFFVEVPIMDKVRELFSKPGFYNDTQFCHNRDKRGDRISDIYDGELYKKLSQPPNVLSSPESISFTWNTDRSPFLNHQTFHSGLYTWSLMSYHQKNAFQKTT